MPCGSRDNATVKCEGKRLRVRLSQRLSQVQGAAGTTSSIEACGGRCERCPTPANSTPSCDGSNCGFTCSQNIYRCGNGCKARNQPCGGSCQGGLKLCGGPASRATAARATTAAPASPARATGVAPTRMVRAGRAARDLPGMQRWRLPQQAQLKVCGASCVVRCDLLHGRRRGPLPGLQHLPGQRPVLGANRPPLWQHQPLRWLRRVLRDLRGALLDLQRGRSAVSGDQQRLRDAPATTRDLPGHDLRAHPTGQQSALSGRAWPVQQQHLLERGLLRPQPARLRRDLRGQQQPGHLRKQLLALPRFQQRKWSAAGL